MSNEQKQAVEGRLAKRSYQAGDTLPAVGSLCLVSGPHCDIESDQHRSYRWRTVVGYSAGDGFMCLQTADGWPTVERTEFQWFAEIPTPRAALAAHPEQAEGAGAVALGGKSAFDLTEEVMRLADMHAGDVAMGYRKGGNYRVPLRAAVLELALAAAPHPPADISAARPEPLTEPVTISKAMRAHMEAHVELKRGIGPECYVGLVNMQLTGWGQFDAAGAEAYAKGFNRGSRLMRDALAARTSEGDKP